MIHRIVLHFISVAAAGTYSNHYASTGWWWWNDDDDDDDGGNDDDDYDVMYKALEEKTRLTEFNYLNVTETESILKNKIIF